MAVVGYGFQRWYNDPWRITKIEDAECAEKTPGPWCEYLPRPSAEALVNQVDIDLWNYALAAFAPPLVTLLAGIGVFWVAAGFRSNARGPTP
jgi:hypothetical protein